MDKLGFVLVLAGAGAAFAWALARSNPGPRAEATTASSARRVLPVAATIALLVAGAALGAGRLAARKGPTFFFAGALSLGVATALLAATVRSVRPSSDDDLRALRASGATAMTSSLAATAGATLLAMFALRVASIAAIPSLVSAYALGGALVVLLGIDAGEVFVVSAVCAAAGSSAAAPIAERNFDALRAASFDPLALVALPLVLQAFAAIATGIAVLAVRADDGEDESAARFRGFAVATAIGLLSSISATHLWGRAPGQGSWLALCAAIGVLAAWIAALIGRYYDDPEHRPSRTVARAESARARTLVGAALGVEGGLLLVLVAGLSIVAAVRCGELLSIDGSGTFGVAVAASTLLCASGYLDALARLAPSGRGQTLAQDVVAIALAAFLLLAWLSRGEGHVGLFEITVATFAGVSIAVGFLVLRIRGAVHLAPLVVLVPVVHAVVLRARRVPLAPGLAVATWVVAAVGLLLAAILERAGAARADVDGNGLASRLRGLAASYPSLVSASALVAALVASILGAT